VHQLAFLHHRGHAFPRPETTGKNDECRQIDGQVLTNYLGPSSTSAKTCTVKAANKMHTRLNQVIQYFEKIAVLNG
jgi:hypothetical protein